MYVFWGDVGQSFNLTNNDSSFSIDWVPRYDKKKAEIMNHYHI